MSQSDPPDYRVYVGTYTTKRSEGIYLYRLDMASGALTLIGKTSGVANPSFLALHPSGRYLYAVNELGEFAGQRSGAVSAFSVDPQTGGLAFLNQQPSHGLHPCHLSVDRAGRFVLVTNYSSGSVAVLPIQEDGRLGPATDVVQHRGSGVDPRRQEGPHAHSVTLDAANRYAFVADLGLDRVMVYRLDPVHGRLTPNDTPWVQVKPGAGPRHFAFHPRGRYAFVIHELDSTLTAFAYDDALGTLTERQTLSTLPPGFTGTSYCADVHVAPSGQFVYGSNRGHDSIAVFSFDADRGTLACLGHTSTQGKTPRNFAIDPTGTYLLAANQDTDSVVTLKIDPQTGHLTPTGHVAEVPMPVCLKMQRS